MKLDFENCTLHMKIQYEDTVLRLPEDNVSWFLPFHPALSFYFFQFSCLFAAQQMQYRKLQNHYIRRKINTNWATHFKICEKLMILKVVDDKN